MRLHPDVILTDTDDGAVLLHQRTGKYWQLNRTGSRVLRRLLDGEQPDAVAADLADRHHVDRARVAGDVSAVITELTAASLLVNS